MAALYISGIGSHEPNLQSPQVDHSAMALISTVKYIVSASLRKNVRKNNLFKLIIVHVCTV
jgi:hypothetical protein